MRLFFLGSQIVGCIVFMLFAGCERQPNVRSSIILLEKAFPATAAPTDNSASAPPQSGDARIYVQMALNAVRSNDFATAVIMLKASARAPGLTPDQFLLTQQAKQALLTDLQNRAAQKDPAAQAALQAIEQSNVH